jgi:hypothetical protein
MSLDAYPAETIHAELDATVSDLEKGLTDLPLAKGVNRIGDWKRMLEESGRSDLATIAEGLGDLERHLEGAPLDGFVIGETLVRLGTQTEEVVGTAPDAMQKPLHRLASILQHAGNALAGNTTSPAATNAADASND